MFKVKSDEKKCDKCAGQKYLYRIMGGGHSMVNSGGVKIDCPQCGGTGLLKLNDASKLEKNPKRGRPKNELVEKNTGPL